MPLSCKKVMGFRVEWCIFADLLKPSTDKTVLN